MHLISLTLIENYYENHYLRWANQYNYSYNMFSIILIANFSNQYNIEASTVGVSLGCSKSNSDTMYDNMI